MSAQIAINKKAKFDYFIEEEVESGIALEGWEVKSLREGKAQLVDSYVLIKNGEAFLIGCVISPLSTTSKSSSPVSDRTRKLLMHKKEIIKFQGLLDRKGYTLVALGLYWSKGKAKVKIGLGKGKKLHDKRATIKDREWKRDQERMLKKN